MAKELIALLARHGEIPANDPKQGIFRGWMDEALDDTGVKEAKFAAQKLTKYPIKRIVSSPMKRALMTAEIFSKELDLKIEQEAALMPFHTGFLTGENKDEFEDVYQFFMDNPEIAIPRGESLDNVHDRVGGYFDSALKQSEKKLTLFVAHSSTAVCLKNLLGGKVSLYPGTDEVAPPGSVVGIYADGDGYEMEVLIQQGKPANYGS
jgi:broad specificity phosphatase PhoE